jgi:GNAT superfamily N-acetyltransferase
MTMNIQIRTARLEDITQLALLFDAYRVFYRKESDPGAAAVYLTQRIQAGDSEIYVAIREGQLAGFTQLYPLFSSTRLQRMWLLNDLFVSPAHRGKGIAKELLQASRDLCQQTGAAVLLLETEKTNQTGNHLYPSQGFRPCEQSNFYWWEPGY